MFCFKCGKELAEGMKFCPKCGATVYEEVEREVNQAEDVISENEVRAVEPVEYSEEFIAEENAESDYYDSYSEEYAFEEKTTTEENTEEEKINWKEYLTFENLERFAPAAAVFPLGMAIIIRLFLPALGAVLGWFRIGSVILRITANLVKIIFVVATAGSTIGLAYLVVNKKDKNQVLSWLTPGVTLLATISCISISFGWNAVALITGVISVVFGIEFVARIVIGKQPIESVPDPKAVIEVYRDSYKEYRANNPSIKDLKDGTGDTENESCFEGNFIVLGLCEIGFFLMELILSFGTCTLALPWGICKEYSWKMKHTKINGKRLIFKGTGGELFLQCFLWTGLTTVTLGFYWLLGFRAVALKKWVWEHTYIEGEEIPVVATSEKISYFDGWALRYVLNGLIGAVIMVVTCLLGTPWVISFITRWNTNHQVVNKRRMAYNGTGLALFGIWLLSLLTTLLTYGLFLPFADVLITKYLIKHTDFAEQC